MANKTVRITVLENTRIGAMWTSTDLDLSVVHNGSTTIIKSDIQAAQCISGDISNSKVIDLDLTKDVVLIAKSYMVTPIGSGFTGETQITIAGSSSGTHNVSMRYKETPDSVLAEQVFEEVTLPTGPTVHFHINGNLKQSINPHGLNEWHSLGTHSTEWNGTATLSCISQIIQEHTLDSTVDTGLTLKFEIEG